MRARCALCGVRRSEHAPWTTGPTAHAFTQVDTKVDTEVETSVRAAVREGLAGLADEVRALPGFDTLARALGAAENPPDVWLAFTPEEEATVSTPLAVADEAEGEWEPW